MQRTSDCTKISSRTGNHGYTSITQKVYPVLFLSCVFFKSLLRKGPGGKCPDKLHSSGRECLVCSVFCWSWHPLFRKSGSTKTSKVVFLQFHSQKSYLFTFYSSCWCVWVTSKIVRQVWSISVLSVCFVCLFVLGGVGTVWNFLLRGISAEFMKCDLFLVVTHNLCINGTKFF